MASEAEKLERAARGPHFTYMRCEALLQSEYDRCVTRDANGRITQIVITDGTRTKTINITRDANGRITSPAPCTPCIDETVT